MSAVAALVVAHRGGAPLEATLAGLDWVAQKYVLDPGGALDGASWPAGAAAWTGDAQGRWLVLVAEGERVDAALEGRLAARDAEAADAHRIAVECHAFGAVLRLRRAPVRLVRGGAAPVVARLDGEIAFRATTRATTLAGTAIVRTLPPLPREAVDALNAEAAALAALAVAAGCRPRFVCLLASGLAGSGRALFGRARGRLGWGRWIAAVFGGYLALLAQAKLWERVQLGRTVA